MELCVMCGNVLPTESGSQVCKTCEVTAGIKFMHFTCPECGKKLELWGKYVIKYLISKDTYPIIEVDLIYHCNNCHSDWDSEYTYKYGHESQSKPKRHYWG